MLEKCPRCKRTGNLQYYDSNSNQKGGIDMVKKKTANESNESNESETTSTKKVSKTELKIENAKKLLEFAKNDLVLNVIETSKTLSCAYGLNKKNK